MATKGKGNKDAAKHTEPTTPVEGADDLIITDGDGEETTQPAMTEEQLAAFIKAQEPGKVFKLDGVEVIKNAKGQIVPVADLDHNKNKKGPKGADVVPELDQLKVDEEGMKTCAGNHSRYKATDENFPPESPYFGRYSRDFLNSRKDRKVEPDAPVAPVKGRTVVIPRGNPQK